MVNDHLSDFVARVKNGYRAGRTEILVPASRAVENVAQVLVKEGYLKKAERQGASLHLELKYKGRKAAIQGFERVSKPSARIYSSIKDIKPVLGGIGRFILSTPKGVVSDKEAKKLNAGGEVIAKIW